MISVMLPILNYQTAISHLVQPVKYTPAANEIPGFADKSLADLI